jgi:hypothetical protein
MSNRKQRLELTWIGKDERPHLEPRILLEDADKSYHAGANISENDIFDNILIHGDNLLALKALEQEFEGRVQAIYIDPPFNTGDSILYSITSQPAHEKKMKYKVVRDPMNLGHIYIINHHTGEQVKVPATVGHYEYACGRTLHQHRVTLNNAKLLREKWEEDHWSAIIAAKDELAQITLDILKRPKRKKIEQKVARFLDWDRGRRIRSTIAVPTPADGSGSRYLPLESPRQIPVAPSHNDVGPEPKERKPSPTPDMRCDLDRELEEKLARKKWGVTHR